jgi:hypothetical protein
MTILSKKHFLRENKEFISTTKLRKKWINWDKDVLWKVKSEGEKDEEYKKELDFLETESEEKVQNILHQEDRVLFRKLKLGCPWDFEPKSAKANTTRKLLAIWAKAQPQSILDKTFGGLA